MFSAQKQFASYLLTTVLETSKIEHWKLVELVSENLIVCHSLCREIKLFQQALPSTTIKDVARWVKTKLPGDPIKSKGQIHEFRFADEPKVNTVLTELSGNLV